MQIYLEKQNIQTRVVFTGNVMRQPMCNGINFKAVDGGCPNADEVMRFGILLPVHHGLTEKMFNRFHSTIDKFISEYC
jgi:CDP-6-deoxy-D-xylo-4-hexulose-3-dehydrase